MREPAKGSMNTGTNPTRHDGVEIKSEVVFLFKKREGCVSMPSVTK